MTKREIISEIRENNHCSVDCCIYLVGLPCQTGVGHISVEYEDVVKGNWQFLCFKIESKKCSFIFYQVSEFHNMRNAKKWVRMAIVFGFIDQSDSPFLQQSSVT